VVRKLQEAWGGNILKGETVNSMEATAAMYSMSTRASMTRAQVARLAEGDFLQMATQLEHWAAKLEELVAKVVAAGAESRSDEQQGIDDLKTKYEIARATFAELKTAGGAKWGLFKASIERAWNDLEGAFEKWAS